MGSNNVAIVFAPTLLRAKGELSVAAMLEQAPVINSIVETLIVESDTIFQAAICS